MTMTVLTYLAYLAVSIGLTMWVARALFTSGSLFLVDTFDGNAELATSVNKLLVIGFYLINFGYITLNLKIQRDVIDVRMAIEVLSGQVGLVLLVLGGMHFGNMYVFNRIRRRNLLGTLPPPVEPSQHLQDTPVEFCTPVSNA